MKRKIEDKIKQGQDRNEEKEKILRSVTKSFIFMAIPDEK